MTRLRKEASGVSNRRCVRTKRTTVGPGLAPKAPRNIKTTARRNTLNKGDTWKRNRIMCLRREQRGDCLQSFGNSSRKDPLSLSPHIQSRGQADALLSSSNGKLEIQPLNEGAAHQPTGCFYLGERATAGEAQGGHQSPTWSQRSLLFQRLAGCQVKVFCEPR